VDYFDPNLVYAATGTSGSMKVSVNGGISWTNADLPVTFYSLAASLASSGSLYAGTSAGLYHFQSGSWTQIGLTDHEVTAIAADPNQANVLYAGTTSDAYYSFDGGLSWKPVDAKLHNLTVQSISIDPTRNNRVYFSTTTHGIYLATIYH
jgi:hypothetical protein